MNTIFISTHLAIGGAVYLLIVRRVLMRDGHYVNLWPGKLDLEELVYRPVLARFASPFPLTGNPPVSDTLEHG